MSKLIKGMEMPKLSESITIYSDGRVVHYDTYTGGTIRGKAVEIPPHGRLIDADATRDEIDRARPGRCYEDAWALTVIDNAPTVIEAEGEK